MLRNKIKNSRPESQVLNKLLNNSAISIKNIGKKQTRNAHDSERTSEEFCIQEVRHIKEEMFDVHESSYLDTSEYSDNDHTAYIDDRSANEICFAESINFQAAYGDEAISPNEKNDPVPLHDLIDFTCTKCRKTSKNPDYFVNKTDLQCSDCQATMKFQCPRCKLMFRNFDNAVKHAKQICTVGEPELSSPLLMIEMKDDVHKCLSCGFSSENTVEFRRHIRFAHPKGETAIACSRCSKSYKSRGSMMKHLRLCGQEPHIICVFCGYKTKRREHLRMHMRHKHPDPESCHGGGYNCPKCNKKYKYLMAMKSHLKTCGLQKSDAYNDAEGAQEETTEETVEVKKEIK